MSKVIESLIEHRESLNQELGDAEAGVEESRAALNAANEAHLAAKNKVDTVKYQLMEVSTAIDAIEKASKAAEEGYVAHKGVSSGSPYRRQRRNIRAMVMEVLRNASEPMDVKEIMNTVGATKIAVNKTLTRLMMLGQVTPVEGGWIAKKEDAEDLEEDNEEEEEESVESHEREHVADFY